MRIFTACRGISRVRLTRFEQRGNEDESSSVHRETVAFTMRVKPGVLEKQQQQAAAAAAIPCQYIRESPTTEKKIAFERTEFGRWSLDDRRGEDITRDSHLQVCLLRHHDRRHSEETRGMYQYWERRSGTKSQKLIEKTCEDWSHCLYRRSFESVKWAIFVQSEDP